MIVNNRARGPDPERRPSVRTRNQVEPSPNEAVEVETEARERLRDPNGPGATAGNEQGL